MNIDNWQTRQYEQAALMANDIKDYNQTFQLFEKATELMITDGTRDSAGILLERGAKYERYFYYL